jgi:hypothetical protein
MTGCTLLFDDTGLSEEGPAGSSGSTGGRSGAGGTSGSGGTGGNGTGGSGIGGSGTGGSGTGGSGTGGVGGGPFPPDAYGSAVLADRPLLYYRFNDPDDDGFVENVSPNGGPDASVVGPASFGLVGALRTPGDLALGLEGEGFVTPEEPIGLALHKGFTAEYWFSLVTVDEAPSCLLTLGRFPESGLFVSAEPGPQGFPLVRAALSDGSGIGAFTELTFDWPPGDFAYLGLSFDGISFELCMGERAFDHFECSSAPAPMELAPIFEDATFIGSNPDIGCGFFGAIDEFAIYDLPLGAPAMNGHYLAALSMTPVEPPPPPPVDF